MPKRTRSQAQSQPDDVIHVEGELVQPDWFDRVADEVKKQQLQGNLTRAQLRNLLNSQMYSLRAHEPDLDPVRAIIAGLGGAVGSYYKWLGAAAGAGAGALLWDMLKVHAQTRSQQQQLKRLAPPRVRDEGEQ